VHCPVTPPASAGPGVALRALMDDPFSLTADLTSTARKRLKLASALSGGNLPAWTFVPGPLRDDGRAAWTILSDLP
jgi:hypothetical protein